VASWTTYLDAKVGGRCYLSRNAYLRGWLAATRRITEVDPDVLYLQVGTGRGILESVDRRLTVVQSVTCVGEDMASKSALCALELEATRRWCRFADVVVANSTMHATGLIGIGVPESKVVVVRPASGMPYPCAGKRAAGRPLVCGHAGQAIWWKRKNLAERAALGIKAEFRSVNDLPHNEMPGWYRSLDLLLLPSVGDSWGLAASEAISCGVPAVVSPGAGVAEQIAETGAGVVARGNQPQQFLDAVLRAVENLETIRAAARAAPLRTMSQWARDLIAVVEDGL